MTAVGLTPCITAAAEDVRDLQMWTGHVAGYAGGSSFGGVSRSNGLITVRSTLVATWV